VIKAQLLELPSPQLRKQNTIKTIHASLKIEGNTLTENQITTLLENKRVIGPEKEITEVLNAIETYKNLTQFSPDSSASFLAAHKMLMKGLVEKPGSYRKQSAGIVKGSQVTHVAGTGVFQAIELRFQRHRRRRDGAGKTALPARLKILTSIQCF
jgi:Fic family protein